MMSDLDLDLPADPPARDASCERCSDLLAFTQRESPIRRVNNEVHIFRCPGCGGLVLDDYVGFKGHGTLFQGTAAEILAYIKDPPARPWPILPRSDSHEV